MARFDNTYCSQCGGEFGSGDSGFSHCDQHAGLIDWDELSPAVRLAMEVFLKHLEDRRAKERQIEGAHHH
jgi:hypothetical protein